MRGKHVGTFALVLLACVACTTTPAHQAAPPKHTSIRPTTTVRPTTTTSLPPLPTSTQSPLSYVNSALDMVQDYAYNSAKINWPQVRSSADAAVANAKNTGDTYPQIVSVLSALGDHHSTLIPPATVQQWDAETPADVNQPAGWSPARGIRLLTLPSLTATSQAAMAAYVTGAQQQITAGEQDGTCGWIVDLRQDTGGNMWPMLASVAPLLGDGTAGSFVALDGTRQDWTLSGGTPADAGETYPYLRNSAPTAGGGTAPVAVLTGQQTASGGEAIAVAFRGRPDTRSFGAATKGVPTALGAYRLSDGADLLIMELLDVDRTGHVYSSPLQPDQPTPDPAVDAAVTWLHQQPACAHR